MQILQTASLNDIWENATGKMTMLAFSWIGHFFLSRRVGGNHPHFTSHPHHSFTCSDSFEFSTFSANKVKACFSPRVGCQFGWESEISATISAQNFIEHPPSLPFLGMIKIGVMKFISDFKIFMLEFQLIKSVLNNFTVTNIRSKHKR